MDPLNPWLDPSDVRHLAEQLLRPIAPARLAAADPGFDTTFVGFIDPERQSMETLIPAVEKAMPPVMTVSEVPQHEVLPIQTFSKTVPHFPETETQPTYQAVTQPPQPPPSSETRFRQRVVIFRDWLSSSFQATDIFILDEKGEILFDESGHGRLHHMARNLNLASASQEIQQESVHVQIGPGSVLMVMPCETATGRIVLGASVLAALPAASVRTIIEVLIQTLS